LPASDWRGDNPDSMTSRLAGASQGFGDPVVEARARKGGRASWSAARHALEAGFTLLEVLVALAILGIAVVTVMQVTSQSLRLVKVSGNYQQAVQLADRIATQTQPTDEAVDAGEEGGYTWERRISLVPVPEELELKETIPGRAPARLFAVTILVRWGQNQMLELATLRTPVMQPPTAQRPSLAPETPPPVRGTTQPSGSSTGTGPVRQ
jgi:type II secretion system protein I